MKSPILCSAIIAVLMAGCSQSEKDRVDLSGVWQATIETPNLDVSLYYRLTQDSDGNITALFDSPLYGIKDVPVPNVDIDGENIELVVKLFSATYRGTVSPGQKQIVGTFQADGDPIELQLNRISDDPTALQPYMAPRLTRDSRKQTEYTYAIPVEVTGDWPVASASDVGLDPNALQRLMDYTLAEKYPNLHSILIARHGKLVFEEYFYGYDADTPHPIYSNGKGVTAATIGIALNQGITPGLDAKISSFFPEYSVLFDQDGKRDLNLEHFLSMTAGYEWNETSTSYYDERNSNRQMRECDDGFEFLFSRPLSHQPGTTFTYNSGIPNALNEIISRTSKTPYAIYTADNLFRPMGFHDYLCDPREGYLLRPRDFLKLAKLYMDRGRWNDKQLVPAAWFDNCYKPGRQCDGPEYWNHWGKNVLFIDGIPVVKYSGGGFGGQNIMGFPDLDLVVAFTGGNYFSPSVNHHDILRNYILPAIISPESGYTPPDNSESPGYTAIDGLDWKPSFFTNLGSLWGCLDYLGVEVSEPWLYGITGQAFMINGHPKLYPGCLGRWNNKRFAELTKSAGVDVTTYAAHKAQPNFEKIRENAWHDIRLAIDQRQPAYGFHMSIPESYVIYGYDDYGYYYKGVDCRTGYGPACWNKLAQNDVGWFEMHTVGTCPAEPKADTVIAALKYAVELSDPDPSYQHGGFTLGLAAYGHWQNALASGDADPMGVAYTAAGWATCRRNAVLFLIEAREILPSQWEPWLSDALDCYRKVADCWDRVSQLFPYENQERWQLTDNWNNDQNRARAGALLEEAAEQESKAINAIANALVTLGKGN